MKHTSTQQGFSLLEVLIATLIAAIAILGIALLEIKMLQAAKSSFHYTVSTIRENNLVVLIWLDLCGAQTDPARYNQIVQNWQASLPSGYTVTPGKPGATFALNTTVELSWTDRKINEAANNQLTLLANFPDVCS